jgi:hypothetical protein
LPKIGKKTQKIVIITSTPGANPTSYNTSAVTIYNATSSLVRFENKNIFFHFEKRSTTALAL